VLAAAHAGDVDTIARIARRNRRMLLGIHAPDGCTPSLIACKHGHLALVKFLFANGASMSDRDRDPKRQGNALHYAAWGGSVDVVRWLVDEQGASLDEVDIVGNTALLYAVYGGHRATVDELLRRGRSLQERNSKNHTALLQAACGGHLELVQWLLQQGFTLDEADHDGNTALLFAAWGGHLDLIHFLLANGSSLHEHNHNGHSIFLSAANGGRVAIVEWLLDQGFSLTETNNNGDTALLLAAYGGHRHLVERLLELGASLDDKNACGFTPLLSAANGGQLDMARWLLQHGSSLDEADFDGYTSLILAACGGNIELVKFFLDYGATITEKNANGDTALLLAAYCGNRDLVDWLLRNGSSLHEKNFTGMGALISAANGGDVDVVELLLQRITEQGPDCGDGLEATDEGGYTPLLLAAQRGHLDVVKTLAKYGANLHAVTTVHGNNAIMLANDAPEVQRYLVRIWLWRPLQIAADIGDHARCNALVQAGVDAGIGYTGPLPVSLAHARHVELCERGREQQRQQGDGNDAARAGPAASVMAFAARRSRDPLTAMLRDSRKPWAPSRHYAFPLEGRRLVYMLALMLPRINASTRLPGLPHEMWTHIMSFLGHTGRTTAEPHMVERGWLSSVFERVTPPPVLLASSRPLSLCSELCDFDMLSDEEDDVVDVEGRRARNSTSKLRCRELFPDDAEMEFSDDDTVVGGRSRDVGVLSFAPPRRFSWV